MMQGFNFENISLWGDSWDELFGITLFNFTLVTAIPAWLYEKNPHIDVGQGRSNVKVYNHSLSHLFS